MKAFLKLVEIQTKLASQLPLLLGTGYVLYAYDTFSIRNFIFMFLSLLTFDMATTAINNYMDYKKSIKTTGYGYEEHNAIVYFSMKESAVRGIIALLLLSAVVFGILLFLNTSIIVLLLGVFSFAIGVVYSFGPVPISRTPFGEIFSGGVMGFVIPFLAVYIHLVDSELIGLFMEKGQLIFSVDILFVVQMALLTVTPILCIANIMLANNICDMEEDIVNRRYTLPLYIGKAKALKLFKWLYIFAYGSILTLLIMRVLPLVSVLALITILPVWKNIQRFIQEQQKKTTFALSVKNLMLMTGSLAITLFLGVAINLIIQ